MSPAISSELLEILADPETHEPVTLATEAQLEALRLALAEGRAHRKDGEDASTTPIEAALLSQGNQVAYLVHGGIANFLLDERIQLDAPLP